MSKPVSVAKMLLTLLISGWMASTQAGQIRYDLTMSHASLPADILGYMVFNDTGPVPGNIFPNIVDWYFNVGGFVFDTSNTQADPFSPLEVDANYNIVNDWSGPFPNSTPCFGANACQSFPALFIGFSRTFGVVGLNFPNDNGPDEFTVFGANVAYSNPIFLNEVPLPPVLGLFTVALASLAFGRRGRQSY